ncbi:MAG: polysulfide reductase NrfD, partial [Cyanobacteria bacterium REEB65]|nr:polysulfide reductase NrfD [Cyanobacteria bacterium REEB65]
MLPSEQPAEAGLYPPEEPTLPPGQTYATVTDQIASLVLQRPIALWWVVGLLVTYLLFLLLVYALSWLLTRGVGIWGIDIPVAWGFAIVNFVFFIEMSHAGTFISAILLLFRQAWRTSINRLAESMTLFAISCAMLFPLFHLGRPWFFYWLWPYPNTMGLWPQWRSPLVWDSWAVPTYFVVSLLFWFTGLVPDLAVLRDRASRRGIQLCYGVLALGWRGDARHWATYERAYQVLAGIATPLVISVMSVVGMDF